MSHRSRAKRFKVHRSSGPTHQHRTPTMTTPPAAPPAIIPITSANGLLFADVAIAVGLSAEIYLKRQGLPVSSAVVRVRAMLDTGASRSFIDPRVLQHFGYLPISCIMELSGITVGTHGTVDVPAYDIALRTPDGGVFRSLEIAASDCAHIGADAILGMDVLAHCITIVNGPARSVSLATVNPPACIRAPRDGATIVDDLEAHLP